jgi:hypothetical protein
MSRTTLALLLAAAVVAQTPDEKKGTLAYLQSLQTESGGFRLDAGAREPSLRATSAALRAIRYFGGNAAKKDDLRAFVEKCRSKEGGFADTPGGEPGVVLTAVGLMAGAELGLAWARKDGAGRHLEYMEKHAKAFEEVRMLAAGAEAVGVRPAKAEEWLKHLARGQREDGTWSEGPGRARDTGGHAAGVLRLGGTVRAEAVVKALDEGQREDGGFGKADARGSDLESTYRVMRTYHMLGKKPARAAAVREFVARCRNKDGGYGLTPGSASGVAPTYFAGIILHWLDAR